MTHDNTHTHTHTHTRFHFLLGYSISIMFIFYCTLYFLSPYPTPHTKPFSDLLQKQRHEKCPASLSSVHCHSHVALWWEISLRNRVELQNERLQRWNNRKHLSLAVCLCVSRSQRARPFKTTSTQEQKQSGVKFVFYIEHTLGGKIEPWTSNIQRMNLWEQVTFTWPQEQSGSVYIYIAPFTDKESQSASQSKIKIKTKQVKIPAVQIPPDITKKCFQIILLVKSLSKKMSLGVF